MSRYVDEMRWPVPVVALVCSSGGLDAVKLILVSLPADLPAAMIVLRHHSPDSIDVLPQVLGRNCEHPVAGAHDGDRLRAGRILVAPPSFHTLVTPDGRIALIRSGDRPPYRPSADLLLTSMALSAGRHAIAVVLSGYGNDGATGATAVHHLGGTVLASDEATSRVFTMPSATIGRDLITDHVLPVPDIAGALIKAVTALGGHPPGSGT